MDLKINSSLTRFIVGLGIIVLVCLPGLFSNLRYTRLMLSDISNTFTNGKSYIGNNSLLSISQNILDLNDKNLTISEKLAQEGSGEAKSNFKISKDHDQNLTVSSSNIGNHISINITLNYRKSRTGSFYSWYEKKGSGTDTLLENADQNGTILDFVIAGFPKCGTTTMSANLGYIAPMPAADVCAPPAQVVYYAYKNWVAQFGQDKVLRGSKCPAIINGWTQLYSQYLPRTKLIIGIRHPVLWFQSFWNMQNANKLLGYANYDPYVVTKPCGRSGACRNGCPHRQLLCLHRGRFHVQLAAFGKTALSEDERKLLAPNDLDGGKNLRNDHIRNPVFLYEQSELNKDYIWNELANYLNVTKIPHDRYVAARGRKKVEYVDFCEEKFDNFRAMMMPYAYDLSVWMQEYFIPVAKNKTSDVTIASPDAFAKRVEEYKKDPCKRLFRVHNGTYVLQINKTIE